MQIQEINKLSLKLFQSVITNDLNSKSYLPVFNRTYGVILNSESAYAKMEVTNFLQEMKLTGSQLNQTFHKSWQKIVNSSRLELLVEQIMHYMSTYGTDFSGSVYIPDEELDIKGLELPVYSIGALTQSVMIKKCLDVLESGIALTQETIESVINLLDLLDHKFTSLVNVNNKEAKIILMDKFSIYPDDATEFLRYMIYKSTGESLLIKNKAIYHKIQQSGTDVSIMFNEYGLQKLATIFNRFKPIFLSFKKANKNSVSTINKISKLSKMYHVPMVKNPLNQLSTRNLCADDLHWLNNATPYALFKALNFCVLRTRSSTELGTRKQHVMYKIRNGKSWVTTYDSDNVDHCMVNGGLLISYLTSHCSSNLRGKKVYIPEYIEYGLPTSEKMYIGKFPVGTKISSGSLSVGIYWKNGFGATDLDLSAIGMDSKIGWNSYYDNNGLSYSGDMTNASRGAVEYMSTTKSQLDDNYLIKVNCYCGDESNHSYNIIVGSGNDITKKYMMNPENLILTEKITSKTRESYLGVIKQLNDGKKQFILTPMAASNMRVSRNSELNDSARSAIMNEMDNALTLNTLLTWLGCKIVHEPSDDAIDLHPNSIDKSTFVELFAREQ